jgi:hypothetical protein
MVANRRFEQLFTFLFVLFNLGYAIISAFFVQPWGANILFNSPHWKQDIEVSVPFIYYYEGAAGLCLGISVFALIMYDSTIPLPVRAHYYCAQSYNWIMWTVFESYFFAMGYTKTFIAILQILLCSIATALAVLAYISLKDEIRRNNQPPRERNYI